jgi:MbtH protein
MTASGNSDKAGRMSQQSASAEEMYAVVVNDEEQYSIWRDESNIPAGWRAVGKRGPKAECLQYIEEVWIDMRPLSLRKRMSEGTMAGDRPQRM